MAADSKRYSLTNKVKKIKKLKVDCIVITEKDFLEIDFKASPTKKKKKENERLYVLGTRIFIMVYQTACIFQKI